MEKVSVIIPAFNASMTLHRCIHSIQRQTLQDYKIYIVDDCSTDDTWTTIQHLAQKDQRIIPIRLSSNQGPSAARNIALDKVQGEWVCFIDSDDEITDNFFERMIEEGERSGKDIVITSLRQVNSQGGKIREIIADKRYNTSTSEEALTVGYGGKDDLDFLMNLCCIKFLKKKTWDNVRFPVGRLQEDAFVTPYLIYESGKGTAQVEDTFYIYYDNPDSISHKAQDGVKDMRRRIDLIYMYEQHINLYRLHNNQLYKRSRANLLNNIISIYQLHYHNLSAQYMADFDYLHRVFVKHYFQGVKEHNPQLSLPLILTWGVFVLTPSVYLDIRHTL